MTTENTVTALTELLRIWRKNHPKEHMLVTIGYSGDKWEASFSRVDTDGTIIGTEWPFEPAYNHLSMRKHWDAVATTTLWAANGPTKCTSSADAALQLVDILNAQLKRKTKP